MAPPPKPGPGAPTSGWEGWEKDEGRLALQVGNQDALYDDADESDGDTITTMGRSLSRRKTFERQQSEVDDEDKSRVSKAPAPVSNGKRLFLFGFLGTTLILTIATGVMYVVQVKLNESTSSESFVMQEEAVAVTIPDSYRNLADVNDVPTDQDAAIPFLWDLPGDGDVIEDIITNCVGLVAAGGALGEPRQTDVGIEEPLEVFQVGQRKFVNVFLGSEEGLERAKERRLVQSGLADVVLSPLIHDTSAVFDAEHPGRLFGLFHHPIQRIASVHHVSKTLLPTFADSTLEEFLSSDTGKNNNDWITRQLSGATGPIQESDFQTAKEVLRQKCLIGLTEEFQETMERVFDYFGWTAQGEDYLECERRVIESEGLDRLYFDLVEEGSDDWNLVAGLNYYDMRLYEFTQMLFKEQMTLGDIMEP